MFFAKFQPSKKLLNQILSGRCPSMKDGYIKGHIVIEYEECAGHRTTLKMYDDSGVLLGECGPMEGNSITFDGIEFRMGISLEDQEYEPESENDNRFDEWNW